MTALPLNTRDTRLRELMDDPGCDLAALQHTYAQFRVVNRLVAGWARVYRRQLQPLLSNTITTTLLDIGCGAGDVARSLAGWAARDGLRLQVIGIDPDPRAHAYAGGLPPVCGVTFRQVTSAELVSEGARFDVVISHHLLHHLEPAELTALVGDSERLERRLVVHNDLARGGRAVVPAAWRVQPQFPAWLLLVRDGDGSESIAA